MAALIILLLVNFFCIILVGGFYIKYALVDGIMIVKYSLKWIPSILLCIQSVICACVYKNRYYDGMVYALVLACGYLSCAFGDILLLLPDQLFFLGGMFCFMVAYIIFGSAKMKNVLCRQFTSPMDKIIFIFIIIAATILSYIIIIAKQNPQYNNIMFIIGLCIYSLTMVYAGIILTINFWFNRTIFSAFSFIGIILFIISDVILIFHDIKYHLLFLEIMVMIFYWMGLFILSESMFV